MKNKDHDDQYTAGFNDGYLISRFEPLQFKEIMKRPQSDDPYQLGIREGGLHHEHSLMLENIQKAREMTGQQKPRMR